MRKALIVGIDNYPGHPLAGCVNDAKRICEILETNGDGSPNFEDPKLITVPMPDPSGARPVDESARENLTKGRLTKEIESLFYDDPEIALLYFSGHGFVDSRGGFLVTTDVTSYDEGVPMDFVLNYANNPEKCKAKDKVIILDCCHSGTFGSPAIEGGNTCQLVEGLSVLTASRASQSALERGGSGVFTGLVLDALRGGAADISGKITAGSIYAYVDRALGPWDQRPIFKTNVAHSTYLRTVPPAIPREVLKKIGAYFPSPDAEFSLDPTYEFTAENHDPAKVPIFKDLQKLERVGLVVPVGEEFMYYAAMNSKSCKLTSTGQAYWSLARQKHL